MIDLGLRHAYIIAGLLLLGLSAGACTYLYSGDTTGSAITFATSTACAAALGWFSLRSMQRRISQPIRIGLAALDAEKPDLLDPETEEQAAPILRTLFMRIGQSRASSVERQRLSEAKIVSVEAAFERIHAVLQSLTEGIVVVDEKAKIVLCNQSARTILAESSKALEGRLLLEVITPELKEAAKTGLGQVKGKDDPVYSSPKLEAKGRIYDLSVIPMRMQRMGPDYGRVLLIVDVTESYEI
ncbi:MAG: PAS domain S-box protein, partial [Planctomycetota bacterium]